MNDVTHPNVQNRHSLTCKVVPEEMKMPHRPNKIEVKWQNQRMLQLTEIMVGAEVIIRFNAKRYHGTVTDFLDWAPPKKKHKLSKVQKPTKERKMNKRQQRIQSTYSFR